MDISGLRSPYVISWHGAGIAPAGPGSEREYAAVSVGVFRAKGADVSTRWHFDRGTLVMDGELAATLDGVVWDERTQNHRASAHRYRALRAAAVRAGEAIDDPLPARWRGRATHWIAPVLRPYQRDALTSWLGQGKRGVVVLPTGAGKTRVALAAAAAVRGEIDDADRAAAHDDEPGRAAKETPMTLQGTSAFMPPELFQRRPAAGKATDAEHRERVVRELSNELIERIERRIEIRPHIEDGVRALGVARQHEHEAPFREADARRRIVEAR